MSCLKPLAVIKCKIDKTVNSEADYCINQNGCEPSLSDEELYDVKKRTSNHVALLGGVLSAFGIIELIVWIIIIRLYLSYPTVAPMVGKGFYRPFSNKALDLIFEKVYNYNRKILVSILVEA